MQKNLKFGQLVRWIEKLLNLKQTRKSTLRCFKEPSLDQSQPQAKAISLSHYMHVLELIGRLRDQQCHSFTEFFQI
ncbi:hypothetical protein AQUCO_02200147v1 [Aquilegia coerulea]|uniref:Uncharacterized protein n=1 Tax=Aquilegia coerulea TaxID=218851 RepID=A0A2G5DDB9_AQUCA|nr:hypothetical protein AQUCO_02200147v1 [Aquilegia coerulea]